ncbi:MAG: hypothetical protein HW403_1313 [Dehalococcoidia bacterium]|nr:hypothetical protein [Dehalococcoidia bacterium]
MLFKRFLTYRPLALIALIWLAGVVLILGSTIGEPEPIEVVHWANGHMMDEPLLPTFSKQFNADGYRTQSGRRIKVRLYLVNSGVITCQLIHRIKPRPCDDNEGTGGHHGDELPDPTIVTPVADHWLSYVNYAVGRTVVDLSQTKNLVTTWIGIVTLPKMAQCLGWPNKEIGIADILALRNDPKGWESCPIAEAEWGKLPLVSYTDPNSSSTGRSMLLTLYAIAAGKQPEALSLADVEDPAVVQYVRRFQRAVDHYVPDTLILNTKIYLGPRYGHFFFIAEDNLVKLSQGKIKVSEGGVTEPRALKSKMIMIYPKEGSIAHTHSAAIVQADWVSPEHAEAAQKWIEYLYQEPSQRAFVQEGFRPATDVAYKDVINPRYGLDPSKPRTIINPNGIQPAVAEKIVESWGDVKNSGVVTFVVDNSMSMAGNKMDQAREGVVHALDNIYSRNRVGLLTFSAGLKERVEVAPITENRFRIREALDRMGADGGGALYDAIKEAIQMTDLAGGDPQAIRGVVVLTSGRATGGTPLHDLVKMLSTEGKTIRTCSGFERETTCLDEEGKAVTKQSIIGTGLIHVFFVGVGEADLETCRILAEATGSACKGATEKDLGAVLEAFSKYF